MTLLSGILSAVTPEAPRQRVRPTAPPVTVIPPRGLRRVMPAAPEPVAPVPAPARPRQRTAWRGDDRNLDAPWAPDYFKTILKRQDTIPQASRVGSDYVHVSSLIDFCPRAYALAQDIGVILDPRPTGGHRVMWEIGRAVERHVRSSIIAARDRQGILGVWQCPCERLTCEGTYPADEPPCDVCGHMPTRYKEMTLYDHDAGVSGNPDLPVLVGELIVPLEVKSMNAKDWEDLKAPLPDHVFQALGYDKLFRHNGYATLGQAVVLYVTKDFKWGDPYKEYHVNTRDGITARVLDLAWEEARELRMNRQAGILPARAKCDKVTCTRAKNCPCAVACFQRAAL